MRPLIMAKSESAGSPRGKETAPAEKSAPCSSRPIYLAMHRLHLPTPSSWEISRQTIFSGQITSAFGVHEFLRLYHAFESRGT